MRKIKILYVITELELGGAQKQLLSLIVNLDKQRFTPFLFTAQDGLLLQDASSIQGLTFKRSSYLERRINPLKDILALIEIYTFIKKNGIDIVHTHSSKAGILGRWAAKLAKARAVIHTVHGWSFNDFQPALYRRLFVGLERVTARFTDRLIVVCEHDRQKGLSNHIGEEDKYSLIRYGINYAEFSVRAEDVKEELRISPKDLVVGMISCFKPQKSPQDFVRLAFLIKQTLPDVKFILVGDGVLRKSIEKSIAEFNLGRQVILAGWRKDIPRILSSIDVFVLTSLWEGLPISVLEAMAIACPVVVTDTGGISEAVVEGKTGFLVPPKDMKSMHERLVVLLKDENLRRQIGQSAKNSLGWGFRLENMVNNNQCLYEDLIKTEVYVN